MRSLTPLLRAAKRMRSLLILSVLLSSMGPLVEVSASRQLQAQQQQQPSPANASALQNVAPRKGIDGFLRWQHALNDSVLVYRLDAVLRFRGSRYVPFQPSDQMTLVDLLLEVATNYTGFAEFVSFKEFYIQHPDPNDPTVLLGGMPTVDLALTVRQVLSTASVERIATVGSSTDAVKALVYALFQLGINSLYPEGSFGQDLPPLLMDSYLNLEYFSGGYTLHPIIVMSVTLAVTASAGGGLLKAEQVTAVARTVEDAIQGGVGTLVEVVNYSNGTTPQGGQPLTLEVTMFTCRDNATVPYPDCERQILEAVLGSMMLSADAHMKWQAAGIARVALVSISQLQPPSPPDANATPTARAPWHLDRIDQRSLPLDGKYTVTAGGTCVHVYVISSGVRADHQEFARADAPGVSRVEPAWGYQGLDASQDCDDGPDSFGYGTYAASLCCGRHLGPAKNATIHSVRMRKSCMENYDNQAFLGALDYVIANHTKPAVVIIDAWWEPPLLADGASGSVKDMLVSRLDSLAALNVTMVAAAGPGLNTFDPCNNVLSNHPMVISVASSDIYDQASAFGPRNSACIEIFAPGGGLGTALLGASPAGTANYTQVLGRAFAAAPVVAGVAAQYLETHPAAAPSEVRRVLLEAGTPHTVTGTGLTSTTTLLYSSNFSQQSEQQPTSSGSAGLTLAAIVGISLAALAAVGMAGAAGFVLTARKNQPTSCPVVPSIAAENIDWSDPLSSKLPSSSSPTTWEISSDDVEILRGADGTELLLGEGRYGRVYKALKGGVQEVAVKKLTNFNPRTKEMFAKEIDMMRFVSRDANITLFYGAIVQGDEMCLVAEYMEGGDLREALSRDSAGELRWHKRGKAVVLDVIKGLYFLHANSVVHRDIKSRNILLGAGGRAKLSDVGLALLLHGHGLQEPAGYVGTLAWAAPEVLLGGSSSKKADIYSMGVVLWEVATQEVPLRGRMRAVHVPSEAPQGVADAIAACLQQDPDLRPSAKQLYSMLLACPPTVVVPGEAQGSGNTTGSAVSVDREGSSSSLSKQGMLQGHPVSLSSESAESRDIDIVVIDPSRIEFCSGEGGGKVHLGSGSFGKVWKVLLDGVHPLALKEVWLGRDARVHTSFLREAKLLWNLRHPNVVGLTGVCISEGHGWLLMDLMELGSLHSQLGARSRGSRQRTFSWHKRGKNVALDIAMGLHFLHGQKVIHFDLKSANVLLDRHLRAKVGDVGLARVMAATHHTLSQNDSIDPPGTLAYMAPELVVGSSQCGPAVDVFSFGILLWEICTGLHPQLGRMTPLSVPQDCPREVADLFMQCTATDPAARPSSKELVDCLSLAAQASDASSVLASPVTPAAASGAEQLAAAAPAQVAPPPQPASATPAPAEVKSYIMPKHAFISPFEALRRAEATRPSSVQSWPDCSPKDNVAVVRPADPPAVSPF